MPEFGGPGKTIIVPGLGIAAVGLVISLLGQSPGAGNWLGWLGKLPGDRLITRDRVTVAFPLSAGILMSIAGSALLYCLMKR